MHWLFGCVMLGELLGAASAVDLRLYYADYSCNGNRLVCSNIAQKTCCRPKQPTTIEFYYAASCSGCDSSMVHYAWQKSGSNDCGRVVLSHRGGNNNCISQSGISIFALYGQTWQYSSSKRDVVDDATCNDSVEPDLVEIDGRFFSVNETVSEEQKDTLYQLFSAEATFADIPAELLSLETNYDAGDN